MKGKQTNPVQSKSPRKGTASPDKSGPAAKHQQASLSHQIVATEGSPSKRPPPKIRKLVYRYGQNQQPVGTPAVSTATVVPSVSVLEAAQSMLKKNMSASGSDTTLVAVGAPTVPSKKSGKAALTVTDVSSHIVTVIATEPVALSGAVGKKVIKSVPGQTYIQEVRSEETGELLNFRCKLCKVRFTDLKEIHMRGRRHRLNLANVLKKTTPIPVAKPAPAVGDALITVKHVKKKSSLERKPIKKTIPSRKPAILDNLMRSNIADVLNKEKKKENFTIYVLHKEMRESCVISDRWCIPEPMWDPAANHEVLLCYETDVLMDGSVRMKRCLKVLDNFELIVLLDGVDKTHIFRDKHPTIKSLQEMLDLIRKVTMVKVCSGIKDCDPTEFDNITTKVIEKGGSWYSTECNVEVERGCLGNICKKCTSLRNTLRRRMRRQYGVESTNSNPTPSRSLLSNTMKPVLRTVGEALYLNLQHMSGINRTSVSSEEEPIAPRSREQVLHPELGIYMNSELKERLDEVAANPPPPLTKVEHIVEFDPRTMTKTLKRIHTPIPPSSLRGSLSSIGAARALGVGVAKRLKTEVTTTNQSFVMGNNGELTLVQTPSGETIQLPEGYVLADDSQQWGDGNIVIQKLGDAPQQQDPQQEQFILGEDNSLIQVGSLGGSSFTLEDGEEYEVIGEAPAGVEGESIQVLPLSTNSDIEIIEVDENMIQLVDENSQPEITPVDTNSDIFKFLQAHSRLQGL